MADSRSLSSCKKSLSMLITGLIDSGKSSLINHLFDRHLARIGEPLHRGTKFVIGYSFMYEGLVIRVWDSPGLQAGLGYNEGDKAYISEMKALGCADADLMLFCISMDDIRLRQTHVDAIRSLAKELGTNIWSKAIIVMTFANFVASQLEGNYVHFSSLLEEWRSHVVKTIQEAGVDKDIAFCIPVVPAGYDVKRALPGRDDWRKSLWYTCISRKEQLQAKGLYMWNT